MVALARSDIAPQGEFRKSGIASPSPNIALQRTPSASPPSPLSFGTLGVIKPLIVAIAIGLLLLKPAVAEEPLPDGQLNALAREALAGC